MRPFTYARATTFADALAAAGEPGTAVLAGGTELLNWLRLGVAAPDRVLDISRVAGLDRIEPLPGGGLRIGALVCLNDVAADERVVRDWPVLSEAIHKSASAQLRNLATIGGNVWQKPRCPYFRSEDPTPCNRRVPCPRPGRRSGLRRRWASRAAAMAAAQDAVARLSECSGHELGEAPGAGALTAAMNAASIEELVGVGSFTPQDSPYALNTFGAIFVEIGFDPELGIVRLRRAVGRYSAGRIINPRTARAQVVGGIVWGWGKATMESSDHDERLGRGCPRTSRASRCPSTPTSRPTSTSRSSTRSTSTPAPSAAKAWVHSAPPASTRPSPTRYSTPPTGAFASSQSPPTSSSKEP
jgi:hypothetical protein